MPPGGPRKGVTVCGLMSVLGLPAQPVDAGHALNLSAWIFKLQGLTWPFVELTRHFVQIGLRVHRQVGALRKELPDIEYCGDPYECARGHRDRMGAIPGTQLARLKKEMAGSIVIDLRNIYNPHEIKVCGFIHEGVGRGASAP